MRFGRTRILAFAGATVILLLSFTAAPSLAAEKVRELRDHNLLFISGPFLITICGVTDLMTVEERIHQRHFVKWDNGHFEETGVVSVRLVNSVGVLVAKRLNVFIQKMGEGGLPSVLEENLNPVCAGGSATPGVMSGFGLLRIQVIGEDGTLKVSHVVVTP